MTLQLNSKRSVDTCTTWVPNLVEEEMKETRREVNSDMANEFFADKPECACEEVITRNNYTKVTFCELCDPTRQKFYCQEEDCQYLKKKSHKKKNHQARWGCIMLNRTSNSDVSLIMKSRKRMKKCYTRLMVPTSVEEFHETSKQVTLANRIAGVATVGIQGIRAVMQLETTWASFAKVGWKVTMKTAKQMTDKTAQNFLKQSIGGTAVVQVIMCSIEMGWICKKWYDGSITGRQMAKNLAKCVVTNGAAFAGALAGMKTGAALGSMIGPWGTFIGGIIGSVVGSITAGFISGKIYEKFLPTDVDDDEKHRAEQLKKALQYFCFSPDELKNLDESAVRRRYRKLAKDAHPDSKNRGGSTEEFLVLQTHFAALLAYVDGKAKKTPTIQRAVKYLAITYKNYGF